MIRLNEKWAVGRIDTPPQWTLARRKLVKGAEQWESVSFCQKRETLLRSIREKVIHGAEFYPNGQNLAVSDAAMARLANFPEVCGDGTETEDETHPADQG